MIDCSKPTTTSVFASTHSYPIHPSIHPSSLLHLGRTQNASSGQPNLSARGSSRAGTAGEATQGKTRRSVNTHDQSTRKLSGVTLYVIIYILPSYGSVFKVEMAKLVTVDFLCQQG